MPFIPIVCSSCGKDIQIPDDTDHAVCMYCGISIATRGITQITVGPNIDNLLALANAAHAAGNHGEAYDFANRVLEVDARNRTAWFLKGRAAGWQSSLKAPRLQEARAAFSYVLSATPADDLTTREMLSDELNNIATALYTLSNNHVHKFASVDGTFQDHLTLCVDIRQSYELASTIFPQNAVALENILVVCAENITGVAYKDPAHNNAERVSVATSEYIAVLRGVINDVHSRLLTLKPDAVKPTPTPTQPGCFVVTAAFGNANNFPVRFLRDFRDEVLSRSSAGRAFATWYYLHGPRAAAWVACSPARRVAAIALVVAPGLVGAVLLQGIVYLIDTIRRRP